jgi:hypothetical protein
MLLVVLGNSEPKSPLVDQDAHQCGFVERRSRRYGLEVLEHDADVAPYVRNRGRAQPPHVPPQHRQGDAAQRRHAGRTTSTRRRAGSSLPNVAPSRYLVSLSSCCLTTAGRRYGFADLAVAAHKRITAIHRRLTDLSTILSCKCRIPFCFYVDVTGLTRMLTGHHGSTLRARNVRGRGGQLAFNAAARKVGATLPLSIGHKAFGNFGGTIDE